MKEEQIIKVLTEGGLDKQDAAWCARWIPEAFEGLSAAALSTWVGVRLQVMDYDEFVHRCEYLDIEMDDNGLPAEGQQLDFTYFIDAGLTGVLVLGYL